MKKLLLLWRVTKTDLRLLWFALHHRDRPRWLLPTAIGLALYAVAPFNLALPVLGVVDDFVIVPIVLHGLLKLLPPGIIAGFGQRTSLRA